MSESQEFTETPRIKDNPKVERWIQKSGSKKNADYYEMMQILKIPPYTLAAVINDSLVLVFKKR